MGELIEVYGKPAATRLDNGPELTSQKFVEWAETHQIERRYIQPGKPNQNAFIERFKKSYREEVLDANLFNTLADVQEVTDEWARITTTSGPMNRSGAYRQRSSYHEDLMSNSLLMNCSLDREVYGLLGSDQLIR